MKYVALAALAATYWFLVAIAHLVVGPDCALPRQRGVNCMRVTPRIDQMPEPATLAPYLAQPAPVNPLRKMAVVMGMNAVNRIEAESAITCSIPQSTWPQRLDPGRS